jgi:Spy/CpxP family protein refolding chaperone
MKRGLVVLLALSLGLNAGLLYVHFWGGGESDTVDPDSRTAYAGRGQFGPRSHPEGAPGFLRERLGRIEARLRLEEDQREGMADVVDEMMPLILAQQEVVRESQAELHREYLKPRVDRERILELRRLGSLAQARLDSLVTETMLREVILLSPEQRAEYFEMMRWKEKRERGARMRRGRGRHK